MGCCCGKDPLETAPQRRVLLNRIKNTVPDDITMKCQYVSNNEGIMLYTKCFIPKESKNIKGMICYCLGYADHVEWFLHDIGVNWAKRGYIFFMYDYRSHGRSDGIHIRIDSFDALVNDSIFLYKKNILYYKNLYNIDNSNIFLFGESMGGAVAIEVSKKESSLFNGMILIAPMCKIDDNLKPPQCVIWLAKNCLAPLFPNKKWTPSNDLVPFLSSDDKTMKKFLENPVVYLDKPRLVTGSQLLQATLTIEDEMDLVKLPFLVLHGKDDKVTDPQFSVLFHKQCNSDKKDIIQYEKSWHMLWHELSCKNTIYSDCQKWMNEMSNNVNKNINIEINEEKINTELDNNDKQKQENETLLEN